MCWRRVELARFRLQSPVLRRARPFAIANLPRGTEASVHRSRLSVLAIFAAMAACSTHDGSEGAAILSQDSTLVARLERHNQPQPPALPAACPAVAVAAQPVVASKRQADELTRRAYDAEMLGNVQEAKALLIRASALDATNKSAAYHLGLTSETLGDRAAAIAAYCRYLTLTPTTAESAEARQRVARLSQVETRVAAGSVSESTPPRRRIASTATRHATGERRTAEPRVIASASDGQTMPSASRERGTSSPTPSDPVATSSDVDRTADVGAAGSDGTTSSTTPSVDQPPTTSRTERRGASRTQSAIIGAAAGAIIGGATGRSVKGAVIGAAAGGILGTAVGGVRPLGRGIRS